MTILILSLAACLNLLHGFNLSSARWSSAGTEVMFSDPAGAMAPSKADGIKDGDWIDEFKTAFERWTTSDSVSFNLTYSSSDCGDTCAINNGINEMYWMDPGIEPVDMPSGALAVTVRRQYQNNMVEVDIIVNKAFDQILTPGAQSASGSVCVLGGGPAPGYSNCFDLPSILTHEIGHFFGLDHTSEDPDLPSDDPRREATMYYSLAPDGLLIPLKADDISGMDCLYPSASQGEPYKVEACCESYNPFYRAPGCSHAFSSESVISLDVGGNTSGCGYIDDAGSSAGSRGGKATGSNLPMMLFSLLLPFAVLALAKLRTRRALGKTPR